MKKRQIWTKALSVIKNKTPPKGLKSSVFSGSFAGGPEEARTLDLCVANASIYVYFSTF